MFDECVRMKRNKSSYISLDINEWLLHIKVNRSRSMTPFYFHSFLFFVFRQHAIISGCTPHDITVKRHRLIIIQTRPAGFLHMNAPTQLLDSTYRGIYCNSTVLNREREVE